MTWTTAVPDWTDRIVNHQSLLPSNLPINQQVAELAMRIFDSLILVDVIGQPPLGQATKQWAREFVSAIFGCYDPKSRQRLISEFFLLISKKNSKSTLASAIMLTALILNDRKSAELSIIAPTKEVASNSFNPARDMIKADPELQALFNISEHTRTITHLGTNATLKVYASESDTLAGIKASYILIDELWVFGNRPNAKSMITEATGGLVSRPEGFVIYLTTMSDDIPSGVMKSKLDYARNVRDGKIDDPYFLGLLYEFPKSFIDDKSYLEPKNWYITNPNLNASVSLEALQKKFKTAQTEGEEELQDFTAKHLNVQVGLNMSCDRWTAIDFWDNAYSGENFTLDDLIEKSEVLTIGIDGGGLDDLLGFAVIGRLPSKKWQVWVKAWCHETAFERRAKNAPFYEDFEEQGDLSVVEMAGDTTELVQICKKIDDSGKLDRIGLDPCKLGDIAKNLINADFTADRLISISQNYTIISHVHVAELNIARGDLQHANQPLLNWSMGNCKGKQVAGGIKLEKKMSGYGKIDCVIAMINAIALMNEDPEPPKPKQPTIFFV